MKKQVINRILPHLWRGGLFLVLLVALAQVVPIALGQRNAGKAPESPAGVCSLAWQAAANMPQDFYGGAAASDGTFAYVAGGYSFTSGLSLSTLYKYDPVGNAWTTLAAYPGTGFIEALAVYYPTLNRIYVFGGEDAVSGVNDNNTRIFDITTGLWLPDGATMPDVHSFMAGGYNPGDGMIYILSGYNTGQVTSAQPNTWQYNPVTNLWTDLTGTTPYPHPAGGFGFGVINNHIYTAGGRDASNTVINLTYDFNPAALTYTQKANEPGTNNNVPGSGVASGALWVFGGGNPFSGPGMGPDAEAAFAKQVAKLAPNAKPLLPETTNSTLVYVPGTDTWATTGPNMTSIRSFPGGTNIGNKLLAAGGYNGATTVATAETLNATCLPTPTPTPCPGDQYTITPGADAIVAGTTDSGNHCDDCATTVAIPFPFNLYGTTYNSLQVVSNGFIDFVTPNATFSTLCLPATGFDYTIFPLWHDLRTDIGLSGCTTWANGCGVFTSVSGTAPNRIFNMEWHAVEFANNANTANFEVRLYENGGPGNNRRFDVVYGSNTAITGTDTAGVQGNSGAGFFTQDFCNTAAPSNVSRAYTSSGCGPTVTGAVSRKTHGGQGDFDINLPLMPPPNNGVECRTDNATDGGTSDYTIIVTFAGNVTVTGSPQAQVTMGTGCVGTAGVCTGNVSVSGNTVTVPLTNVTNQQNINVRINGVNSAADAPATDIDIPMGVLWGDTNGNRSVNAADIALDKSRTGQATNGTNFRSDHNHNGVINAADIAIAKHYTGTGLTP